MYRSITFAKVNNVNFYRDVPGADGVLLGTQTIPSLAIGEGKRVSVDWTNIMESGERIIYVLVDPDNLINEIKKDDNSAFTALKILGLPDLAISTTSITFSPAAPKDGDTVVIQVKVQNMGEQEASNVPVKAYEGSTEIGSGNILVVPGNSQAAVSFNYAAAGKPGPHPITIVVDPDNTIAERSKDNNRASKTFGVQNANLWLTEPYISPNGDGIKDSTQFFFRLESPTNVKILIVNKHGKTVRTFSGDELQNTTGGNVTWDGLDEYGKVVSDGQYQMQVLNEQKSNLGSLPVVVDNNRSSLAEAIGTNSFLNNNLTCALPWAGQYNSWDYQMQWFPDESGVLLKIGYTASSTPEYPEGLYTVSSDGSEILRIVPQEWTWAWNQGPDPEYNYLMTNFQLSPNGEKIALTLIKRSKTDWRVDIRQLWVVDRDGRNFILLDSVVNTNSNEFTSMGGFLWSPDNSYIAYMTTFKTSFTQTLVTTSLTQSVEAIYFAMP